MDDRQVQTKIKQVDAFSFAIGVVLTLVLSQDFGKTWENKFRFISLITRKNMLIWKPFKSF